nr:hypothetical protein BdHM001_34840 [Bdellovibrio sp. HM001]
MGSTEFKEIEFKYDACKVTLREFQNTLNTMSPKGRKAVSSWDHYFSRGNNKDRFVRFREDKTSPELTTKVKMNKNNNAHREEVNIHLTSGTTFQAVEKMLEAIEYKLNFSIHKKCFIYFFDEVDVVFYTVTDVRGKVVGQFIEIEFLESVRGKKVSYAMKRIREFESKLKGLGLMSSSRLSKSLWEMYRR